MLIIQELFSYGIFYQAVSETSKSKIRCQQFSFKQGCTAASGTAVEVLIAVQVAPSMPKAAPQPSELPWAHNDEKDERISSEWGLAGGLCE
jgi:hypothetical protein